MRKAAKTLVAGTFVAIPLQLLLCAAATSQTAPQNSVVIKQVQLGDLFNGQTLDVVTTETAVGITTTTGNAVTVGSDSDAMRADAKQLVKSDSHASTVVDVAPGTTAGTVLVQTTAIGNSGDAIATSGADISGGITQKVAAGRTIDAQSEINAYGATIGQASVQTSAVANTQGIGIDGGGTADMTLRQKSAATTHAATSSTFMYSPGEVDQSTIAVSNNLTATGTTGSSQVLTVRQGMTGPQTLAYGEAISGNAQTINNAVTASANNISASNDGGPLDMAASQSNKGYVRAQAVNNAYEFGSNNAMAYGVGNTLTAGETGVELHLDVNQVNSGGVDAVSQVSGGTGYDAQSTSVAMGNAVTGSVCSSCGGQIGVNSRQVNSADITASSTVGITGSSRSVVGVSTAVGNSATYYASQPGH